jgi:uncharacterized protein
MEPFPEEFWLGVDQFNQGQFYACHDTLEAIWMEAPELEKKFYQGILQVAVGLYHLSNGNWRGAVILLGEGVGRLGYYEPEYGGVDVESLAEEARALLRELQQAGPEGARSVAIALGLVENETENETAEHQPSAQLPTIRRSAA